MKKLLIIEDDELVANIYRNKFVVEGYTVEVANDGETGLELTRRFRPDAVILDLMLPKITGIEVMKQLRAEQEFAKLPIIVFSNTYLSNMVREAWKAGATKCLSKASCNPKQVLDAVRSTICDNGTTPSAASPDSSVEPAGTTDAGAPDSAADTNQQTGPQATFVASLPVTMVVLRGLLQGMIKAENDAARLQQVFGMYKRVGALAASAGAAGMIQIAQMADALEALLKELHEKPKNINASTLRTVAGAVDFLGVLAGHSGQPQTETSPTNILVVDDEAISRRAVTHALEKARLKCVNVEDPNLAYKMLTGQKYDLVFLDVDMPEMNGFELCTKLRALPNHKKTPVVFVTALNNFESRASSTMSGGNDFIAKPFLFMELAVKALIYVLRGQSDAFRKSPA